MYVKIITLDTPFRRLQDSQWRADDAFFAEAGTMSIQELTKEYNVIAKELAIVISTMKPGIKVGSYWATCNEITCSKGMHTTGQWAPSACFTAHLTIPLAGPHTVTSHDQGLSQHFTAVSFQEAMAATDKSP